MEQQASHDGVSSSTATSRRTQNNATKRVSKEKSKKYKVDSSSLVSLCVEKFESRNERKTEKQAAQLFFSHFVESVQATSSTTTVVIN
jgi:hypothetical protein